MLIANDVFTKQFELFNWNRILNQLAEIFQIIWCFLLTFYVLFLIEPKQTEKLRETVTQNKNEDIQVFKSPESIHCSCS